jgi:hypothetical protein
MESMNDRLLLNKFAYRQYSPDNEDLRESPRHFSLGNT